MRDIETYAGFSLKSYDTYLALTIIVSIPFFLSRIYEPSLSGDAVKYALIAKNMLKTGNFVVPSLGYEFYYKKPPGFFWLLAASFKLFGKTEFAARFIPAIFAIADSILLYAISKRITGDEKKAFLSAAFFTINFEVIRISTTVRMESFMLFINLLTMFLMHRPDLKKAILCGILIGYGFITKGPFALPGILSLVVYFSFKRRVRDLGLCILSLFVGALPFIFFAVCIAHMHPAFFDEFFLRQIVGRISGSLHEGSPRSFLFYERIVLKHYWPWNVFLFMAVLRRSFLKFKEDLFYIFSIFFLMVFVPLHAVSIKFTRYSYYMYPYLSFVASSFLRFEKPYRLILPMCAVYTVVAIACPCSFHKDKMRDLRALIRIGEDMNLGISKNIDRDTRNAILFYSDVNYEEEVCNITKLQDGCFVKSGAYCIVCRENY